MTGKCYPGKHRRITWRMKPTNIHLTTIMNNGQGLTLRRNRYPTVGHQKKLKAETQILNNLALVVYEN